MNKIKVYYNSTAERAPEEFDTISYNCQGGFLIIYRNYRGVMSQTLIPAVQIARVEILQPL